MAEAAFQGQGLVGEVDFENFAAIRAEGEALIANAAGDDFEMDLSQVASGNSVTVSALVAWYRAGYLKGISIRFTHIPEDLRKIISVSGLTELLVGPDAEAEAETETEA